MIQSNGAHLKLNCGDNFKNFDEKYLLDNFKKLILEIIKEHIGHRI